MGHEPRDKADAGKGICPGWVRGQVNKACNEIDGQYADVMAATVVVCSERGYDVVSTEEATDLDPQSYGPMMLWAYGVIGSRSLAQMLLRLYAEIASGDHASAEIEDREDRLQAMRNAFDDAFRQWLKAAILEAGSHFQKEIGIELGQEVENSTELEGMMAGSQLLGLWAHILDQPFVLRRPQASPNDDQEDPPDASEQ